MPAKDISPYPLVPAKLMVHHKTAKIILAQDKRALERGVLLALELIPDARQSAIYLKDDKTFVWHYNQEPNSWYHTRGKGADYIGCKGRRIACSQLIV